MLISENPIVVPMEAARRYGLNKAVFLQILYHHLDDSVIYKGRQWVKPTLEMFPFWSSSTIKKVGTSLANDGLVDAQKYLLGNNDDDTRYFSINYHKLNMKPPVISTSPGQAILFGGSKPDKKPKEAKSIVHEMNEVIRRVTHAGKLVPYTRYLRLAKNLVDAGYTPTQVDTWYGDGGWWYKHHQWGSQGNPPSENTIRKSIDSAKGHKASKDWKFVQ